MVAWLNQPITPEIPRMSLSHHDHGRSTTKPKESTLPDAAKGAILLKLTRNVYATNP